MGKRYVIELEDRVFRNDVRNDMFQDEAEVDDFHDESSDENHQEDYEEAFTLYRAKGFNSLVFDETGLSKLQDFQEACDDEWRTNKLPDVTEELNNAYKKGFREGSATLSSGVSDSSSYIAGARAMWEYVRRILLTQADGVENSLINVVRDLFSDNQPGWQTRRIFIDYTSDEVIRRIDEYDSKFTPAPVRPEIVVNVGDEVLIGDKKAVVFAVDDEYIRGYLYPSSATQPIPFQLNKDSDKFKLTGSSHPELSDILSSIKEG